MQMNFGVPNLKLVKKVAEKYPNEAVITLTAVVEKGQSRKFELNPKAVEFLGFTKENLKPLVEGGEPVKGELAFSFDDQNRILVVNVTGKNIAKTLVYKPSTTSLSDKRTYDYVRRLLNIGEEHSLELFLHQTPNNFDGNIVYELKPISNTDENHSNSQIEDEIAQEVVEQPITSESALEQVYEDVSVQEEVINDENILPVGDEEDTVINETDIDVLEEPNENLVEAAQEDAELVEEGNPFVQETPVEDAPAIPSHNPFI